MRNWGATGVGELRPASLSEEIREQITNELKGRNVKAIPAEFFAAIGIALSKYQSGRQLAKESHPKQVRANLTGTQRAAERLSKALDKLDGNSRALIDEAGGPGAFNRALNAQQTLFSLLVSAKTFADEYPGRGRLPEREKKYLAADVCAAIHDILGVTPTTTRESTYMAVLTIVLEEAKGKPANEVHHLAASGLRVWNAMKDSPTGEYFDPAEFDPN